MLGDGAIEKYGREDLYDVFRAIMPFGLFKACESAWYLVDSPVTLIKMLRYGGVRRMELCVLVKGTRHGSICMTDRLFIS